MVLSRQQKPFLLALFGFIVATAYVPGWSGAAIPTTYPVLMIVLSTIILFYEVPKITVNHLWGTLFLAYGALSLFWTINFNIGFYNYLHQFLLLGLIFMFGSMIDDLKPLFKGLAIGLGVSALVAIGQWGFNFNLIFANHTKIAGLFVNSNVLCEISVIMLVALLVLKLYWWIPVTLPGIVLVHSRAAILALLITGFWYIYKHYRWWLRVLIPLAIVCLYLFYRDRFNLTSLSERISVWADTFRGLTLFGHGAGSYELMYPKFAVDVDTSVARPRYAHNDFLHLVYELGIGVLLIIPLIINTMRIRRDETLILWSFGIISLVAFPLYSPMSAFIAVVVAGWLSNYYVTDWRDSYRRRSFIFTGNKAQQFG